MEHEDLAGAIVAGIGFLGVGELKGNETVCGNSVGQFAGSLPVGTDGIGNAINFLVGGSDHQNATALAVAIDLAGSSAVGLDNGRGPSFGRNFLNGSDLFQLGEAAGGVAAPFLDGLAVHKIGLALDFG
jgi:hypothetical protein